MCNIWGLRGLLHQCRQSDLTSCRIRYAVIVLFCFFIFFDSVITRQDNEYLKFHKPINSCLCERKTFSMMRKKQRTQITGLWKSWHEKLAKLITYVRTYIRNKKQQEQQKQKQCIVNNPWPCEYFCSANSMPMATLQQNISTHSHTHKTITKTDNHDFTLEN